MRNSLGDLARAWWKCLRRAPRRRRRVLRGAALVEFAVVLNLLMLLLLGVAEFGALYKDLMVLNQATREGARVAVVGATNDGVAARVRAMAPSLDPARLTTEVRFSNDDGATFTQVPGVIEGRNDVPTMALIRVHSQYRHRTLAGNVLPRWTEVTLQCNMVMQRQ